MNLSEFVQKSGMTKAAISDLCGVSRSAISQWDEIPEKHLATLQTVLKDLPDDESCYDPLEVILAES